MKFILIIKPSKTITTDRLIFRIALYP